MAETYASIYSMSRLLWLAVESHAGQDPA